jgi:hypothetical protein
MSSCRLDNNPRLLESGTRLPLNTPPSTGSGGGVTAPIGLPTVCFASRIYMCFACSFFRSSSTLIFICWVKFLHSFIHKLYLIKSRGKTIIYCGGTLTFLTLIQTHTIRTGMNGRNLGPVSTTNGL